MSVDFYPKNVKDLDQEDYDEILEELKYLNHLKAAGVENWEGNYYAQSYDDDDDDDYWEDDRKEFIHHD